MQDKAAAAATAPPPAKLIGVDNSYADLAKYLED